MAMVETVSTDLPRTAYVDWSSILAGAIAAASLSFLLLTFGGAVGLSLTSPWPETGARLWVVAFALMWWMVAVQIGSFAAGGYLAGRLRARNSAIPAAENEFRDGVHGMMVWALGTFIGAIALALVGAGTAKTAVQSAALVGAGAGPAVAQKVGPADYAVDLLFRPQPSNVATAEPKPASANDDAALRGEANRIFTSAISSRSLSQRDYDYLAQVVAARTGLPQPEAQQRVKDATMEAQKLEVEARAKADKARKAALITGFIAAASLLISLGAAVVAAGAGGRHRDANTMPLFSGHRFW